MKKEEKTTEAVATLDKPELPAVPPEDMPFFVEFEKMFDHFAEISKTISQRAFDFFKDRGGEWGHEVEDWFKAQSELLRFVPVEIKEQNGTMLVTADVAGFKPEEIEISVKDDMLMIRGKTEAREEKKDENVFYSDFKSDRFFRRLNLPEHVNVEGAKAEIKDGMLNISLPKAAKPEPKTIAVSAG